MPTVPPKAGEGKDFAKNNAPLLKKYPQGIMEKTKTRGTCILLFCRTSPTLFRRRELLLLQAEKIKLPPKMICYIVTMRI
ncbi:MAG: hypothetical protein CTY19_04180 [Methylomonas sp.]|nr:MAG: hypothetical protein CTY19_04180 [Methylomonas sp.]